MKKLWWIELRFFSWVATSALVGSLGGLAGCASQAASTVLVGSAEENALPTVEPNFLTFAPDQPGEPQVLLWVKMATEFNQRAQQQGFLRFDVTKEFKPVVAAIAHELEERIQILNGEKPGGLYVNEHFEKLENASPESATACGSMVESCMQPHLDKLKKTLASPKLSYVDAMAGIIDGLEGISGCPKLDVEFYRHLLSLSPLHFVVPVIADEYLPSSALLYSAAAPVSILQISLKRTVIKLDEYNSSSARLADHDMFHGVYKQIASDMFWMSNLVTNGGFLKNEIYKFRQIESPLWFDSNNSSNLYFFAKRIMKNDSKTYYTYDEANPWVPRNTWEHLVNDDNLSFTQALPLATPEEYESIVNERYVLFLKLLSSLPFPLQARKYYPYAKADEKVFPLGDSGKTDSLPLNPDINAASEEPAIPTTWFALMHEIPETGIPAVFFEKWMPLDVTLIENKLNRNFLYVDKNNQVTYYVASKR